MVRGAILLLLALVLCAAAVDPRTVNGDWPPAKFTHETTVRVQFVLTQDQLDRLCGKVAVAGKKRGGCVRRTPLGYVLIMPHPEVVVDDNTFRLIAAHELAHMNGWNATHDN